MSTSGVPKSYGKKRCRHRATPVADKNGGDPSLLSGKPHQEGILSNPRSSGHVAGTSDSESGLNGQLWIHQLENTMFDLNPAHLHLLVNHLPVEGSIVALLLIIWSLSRKSAELKRTALIACVVTGIAAFAADYTGGGAARVVKVIPGVDRADIEAHSATADWARYSSYLLAAVALMGLYLSWRKEDSAMATSDALGYTRHHKEPPPWVMIASLIIALLTVAIMAKTAYLGGTIRHPEIEPGFQTPAKPDSTKPEHISALQGGLHLPGYNTYIIAGAFSSTPPAAS